MLKVGEVVEIGSWKYRRISKTEAKKYPGQLYEMESNLSNVRGLSRDGIRVTACYIVIRVE